MPINYSYLIAFALAILSFYFFEKSKTKLSIFLLFTAAICLRIFLIYTDDYLHEWDERFHALVAKNLIDYPFKPMLRIVPVLANYDYTAWCCNHIWLHKQPLFLWQMAISMKIFGINTFALRLPSVIMGALLVFPIYRIGKLVFDARIGYYAAFLSVFAYYQIELISGYVGMDHNDIAFLFYTTLSIWAYFEYLNKPNPFLLISIGFFSGAAILCKWLTGLLVYLGWFANIALNYKTIGIKHQLYKLAQALSITVLTFLPWQIYIGIVFPKESSYERSYNTKHIFEVVEGHDGTSLFYLGKIGSYYSLELALFIIAGLIITFRNPNNLQKILLSYIIAIYFFFSVVVKTKISTYTYVVAPLVYLLIANSIAAFLKNVQNKLKIRYLVLIMLLICAIFTLQPNRIYKNHYTHIKIPIKRNNTKIYKKLDTLVPPDYTIFNCKAFEDVEAMFFSNRNVYQWCMTEAEYHELKSKGVKIAAFKNHTNQPLPNYIANDKTVLIINEELK